MNNTQDTDTITKAQIRPLRTIAGRQMNDDDYRSMLQDRCGVESTKALTRHQAAALIDHLQGKAERPGRNGGITRKQLVYLADLQRQCGRDGDAGLRWASSIAKRTIMALSDLSRSEANRCIQAANQMLDVLQKQQLPDGAPKGGRL